MLHFPAEKNTSNLLQAFWQWASLLADENIQPAVEALVWKKHPQPDPQAWQSEIREFFFGPENLLYPFCPPPGSREVFEEMAEIEWEDIHTHDPAIVGWAMFYLPLIPSEEQNTPESDLYALPVSFFIRETEGAFAFEFDEFHL
ncbi:MAG: hypothetical protein H6581_02870 [Bacteroidia bacterium]|nr:hypothetical protein [Bacteroidia bacterium]